MFLGEYKHTLDDKSRLTLPAKYRNQLASGIVMTAGVDRYILIYPKEEFERLAERVTTLPLTGHDASILRRLLFVNASDATPDRQGRVVLPENLRLYAGIESDVVIVGVGRFVEMWSSSEWSRIQTEIRDHAALEDIWAKLGI